MQFAEAEANLIALIRENRSQNQLGQQNAGTNQMLCRNTPQQEVALVYYLKEQDAAMTAAKSQHHAFSQAKGALTI
jgi:hypothetical protein